MASPLHMHSQVAYPHGCPVQQKTMAHAAVSGSPSNRARDQSGHQPRTVYPWHDRSQHDPIRPEIGRAHVELQSLMRISYAVFCLKKKRKKYTNTTIITQTAT